jgi:hypothetical protein
MDAEFTVAETLKLQSGSSGVTLVCHAPSESGPETAASATDRNVII